MKQTYNIAGITCSSCITRLTTRLLSVNDVLSADLQFASPQATLLLNADVPLATLQQAIGSDRYTITPATNLVADVHTHSTSATTSVSYYPIYLIFAYIASVSLLVLLAPPQSGYMAWMNNFMAGFFLVFSFFKLLNIQAFAEGYRTYDVVARQFPVYARIYPFLELLLAIAYLLRVQPVFINSITLILMSVSIVGVMQSLKRKSAIQCACLGTIIKLPLSTVTFAEDALMILMSLAMLLMQLL